MRSCYGVVERPAQNFPQRKQFGFERRAIEAPDAGVDGVDRAPADCLENGIAGLLQPQPALDDGAVVSGQRDHIRIAEKVRRVQQINVQGVAGDPLAAVEQPTQRSDRLVYVNSADGLDRLPGAGLVGDRAYAADPSGDVGDLGVLPAAQERLEESWRLVDP